MIIGVPREVKNEESRVGLVPIGAELLSEDGHEVIVEEGAGAGSGFDDEAYGKAGARVLSSAAEVYERSNLIIKVKEPQLDECSMLRPGQMMFTFFHFAADKALTENFMQSKGIAIAYETVQLENGALPLLLPMSEVAGRMAVQEGAKYLEIRRGGRGVLIGGVPGVDPATVAILGGGVVGTNAAKMAAGLGAKDHVLDVDLDRLRYLDDIMPANVHTLMSNPYNIRSLLPSTDLLIGAVLIPGAKAPTLVPREYLSLMKPGAVLIDVAVDQGGCVETCHPTTHDDPIYIVDKVVHYCVANMPGAVPRTSTIALTNATFPYVKILAALGYEEASRKHADLMGGLNIVKGEITHPGVAEAFELDYVPVEKALAA